MMFDLLIKGATIVDGTGGQPWVGDAAIAGDRFAALDRHIPGDARRTIAADGCMLAPGFIDIHCHSDFSLFDNPEADIKLRQGVTLEVLGNCGTSLAPLEAISRTLIPAESDSDVQSWAHPLDRNSYGQYARTLEGTGLSINVTGLVGHGTLRLTAMGPADGRPNPDQMTRMKSLLSQSMEAAVHKMSGMTARRLGLKDTGVLRKGFKADAVLFDPLTFGDMATYDHPRRFPQGLLATIVNGEVVIDGEKHTGAKPGKFFRKGNRV